MGQYHGRFDFVAMLPTRAGSPLPSCRTLFEQFVLGQRSRMLWHRHGLTIPRLTPVTTAFRPPATVAAAPLTQMPDPAARVTVPDFGRLGLGSV
jgi:hypothetical protein